MILPQPCRQLRGKSSTAAHHLYPPWSCDPRVGQRLPLPFSLSILPLAQDMGSIMQDTVQNYSALKNQENLRFCIGKDNQSTNAKAKRTQMLLFKYIKAAVTQKGFGILNLSCIRESMLLGISSLSQDRCLSCLKSECFIAFYVLSLYSIFPFSDYSHLYL